MQDVIIVCAGSYGREMYWCLDKHNRDAEARGEQKPYNILGFLSDVPADLERYQIREPVLGGIQDWQPRGDEMYAMGLGKPESKKKIAELLKPRGCRFISVVGAEAVTSPDLVMGEGCIVTRGSIVGSGVRLGDFVDIHASLVCSGATLERYCTTTGFTVVEEAVVREGVYVGSKATIARGCEVGAWSKVSCGSLVSEDVRPGATVFGMPAREIG